MWCNVTRISSGNCALRITKFDEKISLALIKKENKKAGNNFHMKWNFFKNCLPGIMHLLELKKLQEAESILISWISIELEFFFSHSTWVSSLLESFQLIFQSTATAFVDWLFNYCSKTRHPNLWIAGYTHRTLTRPSRMRNQQHRKLSSIQYWSSHLYFSNSVVFDC